MHCDFSRIRVKSDEYKYFVEIYLRKNIMLSIYFDDTLLPSEDMVGIIYLKDTLLEVKFMSRISDDKIYF